MHLIKDVRKKFMSKQGGLICLYSLANLFFFFFFFPWLHSQQQGAIRASKSSTNYLYISILLSHLRLTKLFWCFAFPFWVPVFNTAINKVKKKTHERGQESRGGVRWHHFVTNTIPFHSFAASFFFVLFLFVVVVVVYFSSPFPGRDS